MRLTQLRSFYAVACTGGFTGAARMLHISQPTVTTQVRFLEDTYGVELFHRRGHSVRLSEPGEQLFELARQIFALETETVNLLKDAGRLETGHLRIGAVGPVHVTDMLAEFNRRFPGIEMSVHFGNSASVLADLLAYRADVAVLAHATDDERFHWMPYSRHPLVVMVHASHRLSRRRRIPIRELDGEPMIMRERGSTTRQAIDTALKQAGVRPRIVMEIGSREAIREAVIKGVGIGTVSDVAFVPDPQLRMIRLSDVEIFNHAHVACLDERRDGRLIAPFLAIAAELRADRLRRSPGD
jgi:aminoethylphosphonate catabolism LysR family transcriptional regulator